MAARDLAGPMSKLIVVALDARVDADDSNVLLGGALRRTALLACPNEAHILHRAVQVRDLRLEVGIGLRRVGLGRRTLRLGLG